MCSIRDNNKDGIRKCNDRNNNREADGIISTRARCLYFIQPIDQLIESSIKFNQIKSNQPRLTNNEENE